MIPDEAVEAAAKVFHQDGWEGPPFWESLEQDDPSRMEYLATARAALEAAAPHMLADVTKLIRDLTDPDDCTFDHHGGCQAHGYLSLEQGETCPQADAKEWAHGDH